MKMVWLSSLRERKCAFAKSSSLEPECRLFLSAFNCLLNFLTALTARQASRICVAFDLVGDGLGPLGQVGKDILLDPEPGGFGGAVSGQEFNGPVVGESGGVKPEFKLGFLLPVWVDSYPLGFSCGTF